MCTYKCAHLYDNCANLCVRANFRMSNLLANFQVHANLVDFVASKVRNCCGFSSDSDGFDWFYMISNVRIYIWPLANPHSHLSPESPGKKNDPHVRVPPEKIKKNLGPGVTVPDKNVLDHQNESNKKNGKLLGGSLV